MPPATSIGQLRHLQHSPETVIAKVRRQRDDDCELGRIAPCADKELDRAATETVQAMWASSRIKTFLQVLALRGAREQLQLTTNP